MERVSIVIPVYNAEKYLRACLDSVLDQSDVAVEVICVDDGSTDGSSAILGGYAEKDHRIKIIMQSNQGPGVARNAGLAAAKGEYIMFLDADDQLTGGRNLKDAFEYAKDNRLDVLVLSANKLLDESGRVLAIGTLKREMVPSGKTFAPEAVGSDLFVFTAQAPWAKLYRREFIAAYRLEFPALKRSEDFPFVMSALLRAGAIGVLDIPLCDHRIGVATSLEATKADTPCIFIEAADCFCKSIDLPQQPEWVRQAFRVSMVCRYAYNLTAVGTYRGFRQIAERFFEETDNLLQKENTSFAPYLRAHAELCQLKAAQGDDDALVELCLAMQMRWRVEKVVREKYGRLQTERDEVRQKSERLRTERDEVRQKSEKLRTERDEARQKSERLRAERDEARRKAEKFRTERDEARLKVQKLRAERDEARAQLNKLKGLADGRCESV